MNSLDDGITSEHIYYAKDKLNYLYALKKSLLWLSNNIETNPVEEILEQIELQDACIEKINEIDKGYNSLFNNKSCSRNSIDQETDKKDILDAAINEQKLVLEEITRLNKEVTEKAQEISISVKEKIQQINQQKNTLSSYESTKSNQSGILFDYKEG